MSPKAVIITFVLALAIAGTGTLLFRVADQAPATDPDEISAPTPLPKKRSSSKLREAPTPPPTAKAVGPDRAFAMFQTGNYAEAVRLLRQKRIENPDDPIIRQNLATTLYAFGLQRLRELRRTDAESLFEEAVELGHSEAATALASLRVKSGHLETALAALERIYDAGKDPKALRALVDLSLSRDEIAKTEYYLNRAENNLDEKEEGQAAHDALVNFIKERRNRLKLRRLFNEQATTLDLGRVQVAFLNEEKRSTAQTVLETMSDSIDDLSRKFFNPPDGQRFRAIVMPQESFRGNTGAPPWAQAIFDGVLRIPVPPGTVTPRELAQAAAATRHETLHAYLYYQCGDVFPSWLGEGLAQMYDGRPLSQSIAALRIKLGRTLPRETDADQWLNRPFMEAPPGTIDELYARSFLLISGLQRQKGSGVWKTLVARVCVEKDPLETTLLDLFEASNGLLLWQKYHPVLSELFLARQ
jgi:tetratricopeptide (TPR) repeat protein